MPNINDKRGGARKKSGRIQGKKFVPYETKVKTYRLTIEIINTLTILGGSKYLTSLLDFFYLKTTDKIFRIPACVYYKILNNLSGVFEITDKQHFDNSDDGIKYDLTTLESIYNNSHNEIVLKLKDTEIIL